MNSEKFHMMVAWSYNNFKLLNCVIIVAPLEQLGLLSQFLQNLLYSERILEKVMFLKFLKYSVLFLYSDSAQSSSLDFQSIFGW